MSSPTPLQSFLGGLGLALPVHALMLLNGNVFGISGFLHRAVRGGKEAIVAVVGLVLGGVFVGFLEDNGPNPLTLGLSRVLLSGFLVGLGSKLSNGCTSGHMISGISRLSTRSFVATATFFTTGVITARISHSTDLPTIGSLDWTLGEHGKSFLAFQIFPFAISTLLYFLPVVKLESESKFTKPSQHLRLLAYLSTGFEFALALRLSNLSEANRVLGFLLLPFSSAFDPSLAFLSLGALPLSIILYRFHRGPEKARLGGPWAIPKGGHVDRKLLGGAALFGVGWGMAGICPGPGLINLGRALAGGSDATQIINWLGAVALGGLLV
ncbi:hypothetical protein BDZ94DRAFT_1207145 [Collybia nuda]|uniref:Sulphur transport domain-containing protein n=1 Tax=Collybia nuda TaxID=64659 RepID=A0A9P6CPD9_9AGAR|nr:hypothetical protein BDZ94DRAFT_1207145 [Collybia nuda]